MKVSKSRIAVLVLIAVTIIYAVMLFQSVQAYNTWKEEQIQYHVEHYGGDRETGIGVPDFPLYFFSTHGQHYFVLSIGISIIWFVYLTLKMSKFALAFIALCVVTILWGTAFHYTRLEYARARPALPYLEWKFGLYIMLTSQFLIIAWGVFFGKLLTRKVIPRLKRLKRKKTTIARAL